MASYLSGLLVAATIVAGLLGFMAVTQDDESNALGAGQKLEPDALMKVAGDPDSEEQIDAILQLGETPGDLSKTVPFLASASMQSDELPRIASEIALEKIGADGSPHLKTMMDSGDINQLAAAATALKSMGGAKIYFPQIREWLESGDSRQRRMALFAMQGSGDENLELMDQILEALDDKDFNTQLMACRVLEKMGPDALPAEKILLRLMEEGNPSVKSYSALVMGAIGPTDDTDTAVLLAGNLDAFLQLIKQRSLIGIAHMGPEASQIEDEVRQTMLDPKKRVMPHAAYALYRITGKPEESIETFRALLTNPSYRDDAIEFVGKMQADGAAMVGELMELLGSPEEGTRELVVVALGNIGAPAEKAISSIEAITKDDDPLIRYHAREALKQIRANKP